MVQFPDGTPRDTILTAMRAKFGGPAPKAAPAASADPMAALYPPASGTGPLRGFLGGLAAPFIGAVQLANRILPVGGLGPLVMKDAPTPPMPDGGTLKGIVGNAPGATAGEVLGQLASPLNYIGGPIADAAGLGPLASAATAGAVSGALQPAHERGFWTSKAEQTGLGAAAGAVLHGVTSPPLRKGAGQLLREGVKLTPGQMFGALHGAEDVAAGTPAWPMVAAGRRRALVSWNVSRINQDVLAPIGKAVKPTEDMRSVWRDTFNHIHSAYEYATKGTRLALRTADLTWGPEDKASGVGLVNYLGLGQDLRALPEPQRSRLVDILDQKVLSRMRETRLPGFGRGKRALVLDGRGYKRAMSGLWSMGDAYSSSGDSDQRLMAGVIAKARESLKRVFEAQNPGKAPYLRAADLSYMRMARYARAAMMDKTLPGEFSPEQVLKAVAAEEPGKIPSSYLKGDAPLQKNADLALHVIGGHPSAAATRLAHGYDFALGLSPFAALSGAVPAEGLGLGWAPLAAMMGIESRPGAAALRAIGSGVLAPLGAAAPGLGAVAGGTQSP